MTNVARQRVSLVFWGFCAWFFILWIYVGVIQLWRSSWLIERGKQQYGMEVTSYPARASIYDRKGQPLAINTNRLSAFITPRAFADGPATTSFLKKYFPAAYERLERNRQARFLYVARKLSPEEIEIISKKGTADIYILQEPSRQYLVESAGPIVGVTNIDNQGMFGMEQLCNERLSGRPTTYYLERDARSGHFYFSRETKTQGHEGESVRLTLDANLQFIAAEELASAVCALHAQEGAVLIMDPQSGDILAMAQYPAFDPEHIRPEDISLTQNKLITQAYELGSVMKAFLALAALEERIFTRDTLIDCENARTALVNGMRVNTWKAHGVQTFSEVIETSNNIGTAKIAQKVGTALYDHYKRLGFGELTGIRFPGEQKGFINPPQEWSKQSLNSLSFGYEIRATLLQLADAFCLIANGGYPVTPRLILDPHMPGGTASKPVYRPEVIADLREILEKTVNQGTAHKAKISGCTVRGKTGSANLLVNGVYSPDHSIYTFSGIVEKGTYQRVIVTFIKEVPQRGVYASTIAVPPFERIAHRMLVHEKIIEGEKI